MSISGIGSSTASFPSAELLPEAQAVAQPNGASGDFALMPFLSTSAGATVDDTAALLTLTVLQADRAGNTGEQIRAALAPFATAIGAFNGNASRRAVLAAENAILQQQIAGLQQQLEQARNDLAAAEASLTDHQKLDPLDPSKPDLVAKDLADIAASQARIAELEPSIARDQSQLASNTAQISALQTTFLGGFAAIASALVQRISDEQKTAATGTQTVTAAVQEISDNLREFLDNAQIAAVLRQVQQRQDDVDTVARAVAAGVTSEATDAEQPRAAAQAQAALNNLAVSRTAPDQADVNLTNQIAPPIDAPPPVQGPTLAPVPAPVGNSSDQENEQDIAAADAARGQDQADLDRNRIRAENAVGPALTRQVPLELPQNPVPDINANASNTERAALQESIAGGTVERNARDGVADARLSGERVQQNELITEVTKKADELAADLNRLVNRFMKPSTTASRNNLVLTSLLDLESPPGRLKIPV